MSQLNQYNNSSYLTHYLANIKFRYLVNSEIPQVYLESPDQIASLNLSLNYYQPYYQNYPKPERRW